MYGDRRYGKTNSRTLSGAEAFGAVVGVVLLTLVWFLAWAWVLMVLLDASQAHAWTSLPTPGYYGSVLLAGLLQTVGTLTKGFAPSVNLNGPK